MLKLSPKQTESFCESDARYNIWVGAVRSGKTFISIRRFIDFLRNGPTGDVMVIGVNRDTIQRNVLNQLYSMLEARTPGTKTTEAKLYNRNVYFVGANDEGSVRRIQGSTLAAAYVDEITCLPQSFWRMLQSRLSVPGAKLFGTCNPEGPSHWFKKQFIDDSSLNLKYWNFGLEDNPILDDEYKTSLRKEYSGMWYKRYILGEWAVATGMIYDCFDNDNIYTEETLNPTSYIAGIDYGTVNATACHLAAINPKEFPQIRIQREYYYDSVKQGRSKTDAELADDIYNFLRNYPVEAVYIDPAAASLKLELRNRNLPIVDAKNDVLPGIQIVAKFIQGKNLQVHEDCNNLIDQLQSYHWDAKAADRGVDKPTKEDDHACDSLRYLIASRFPDGELSHPFEHMSHAQLMHHIFKEDESLFQPNPAGGYL